ncbi:MAG: hypothetical protein ABW154_00635 [Dyella sp.]
MTINWQTVYHDMLEGRALEVRRSSAGIYKLLTLKNEPTEGVVAQDASSLVNLSPSSLGEAVEAEALNRDGLVEALLNLHFSRSAAAEVIAAMRP